MTAGDFFGCRLVGRTATTMGGDYYYYYYYAAFPAFPGNSGISAFLAFPSFAGNFRSRTTPAPETAPEIGRYCISDLPS